MSDLLHIKDSYYFEVPKFLWRSTRQGRDEFPEHWVRLDDEYQDWEANRQFEALQDSGLFPELPNKDEVLGRYQEWGANHSNFAKPFDRFLEESSSESWFQEALAIGKFANKSRSESEDEHATRLEDAKPLRELWEDAKVDAEDVASFNEYAPAWSEKKIDQYNSQLDGKILIPQFLGGKLKNNYEPESGFCHFKVHDPAWLLSQRS